MKILNLILYGNFFIAFCAYAQTIQTCFLLGNNAAYTNPLPIFIATATFFLYNIHKPITFFLKKQFLENQRFLKTKSLSTPLSIFTILAGIFCFVLFLKLKSTTQLSLIVAAVFSLAYVLPIFGKKRLRDLPFIKIFTIALVWPFVTVILPFQEYKSILNSASFFVFIEKVLFIFALTMPFDIRDMEWDLLTKVKTIPLSIGIKKAKFLSILCLISSIVFVFMLNSQNVYSFKNSIALLLSYFISILVIVFTNKKRNDYYYYILVDGMMLLQSILIFLSNNLNF